MRGTKFSVIGMGKYGRSIAQILSDRGAEVIAIDNREEYIEEVEDIVALAVTMDATDGKALESQNIHESDAVVVAIGANFEALLLCCVQLKELGVKRIIARSNDENQKKILQKIGIEEILEPEKEIGVLVAEQLINPSIVSFLQLPDDYEVAEIKPPKDIESRTVEEIGLRSKYRLNLITIKRCFEEDNGDSVEVVQHILGVPTSNTIIQGTDTLIVFGTSRDIKRFIEINN
ncbi:MAG: potassium transporter KtrA [Flavobacteriales bacterium]|jgi:trk system potassium uptake protein TrkA|nr:potassium transporter KtrA [Flavobacteriales bacterium]|tara:strand:+ start:1064 stop:1759 length:696 start_codon:yes stop_codon:yes gene_type:complete